MTIEEAQKAVLAARATEEGLEAIDGVALWKAEDRLINAACDHEDMPPNWMYGFSDPVARAVVVSLCMRLGKAEPPQTDGLRIAHGDERLVVHRGGSFVTAEIEFFCDFSGPIADMIAGLQSLQADGWTSIGLEVSGDDVCFEEAIYRDATEAELEARRQEDACREAARDANIKATKRKQWEELNKIFGERS